MAHMIEDAVSDRRYETSGHLFRSVLDERHQHVVLLLPWSERTHETWPEHFRVDPASRIGSRNVPFMFGSFGFACLI